MQITIELLNEHALSLLRDLERMKIIRFAKQKLLLNQEELNKQPKRQRQLGSMKGLVIYMAPDFNAPLDDFKEYM